MRNMNAVLLTAAALAGPTAEQAVMAPEAEAAIAPVAHTSTFHWQVVGGAPFREGGIDSKVDAAHLLRSDAGHKAMRKEGLSKKDINALDKKAGKDGEGVYDCTVLPNVHYPAMVSKDYDTEKDVVLDGSKYPDGVPAFCVKAIREYKKDGREYKKTIIQAIAKTCANFVLEKDKTTSKKIPRDRKKGYPVFVGKIAEDATGDQFSHDNFPTGLFQFVASCKRPNGKLEVSETVLMHPVEKVLKDCKAGTIATVTEKPEAKNPGEWKHITPDVQKIKVKKSYKKNINRVTFKDREVGYCEQPLQPKDCAPQPVPTPPAEVTPTPTPTVTVTPTPTPGNRYCDLDFILGKNGTHLNVTATGDVDGSNSFSWQDGSANTVVNNEDNDLEVTHDYVADGHYRVTDTVTRADGSKAVCSDEIDIHKTDDNGDVPPPPPARLTNTVFVKTVKVAIA